MTSLSLFVSRRQRESQAVVGSVLRVCEEHLENGYHLRVVDLDQHPLAAAEKGLIATPALEVRSAGRTHVIVGDLGERTRLAEHFGRLTE